VIERLAHAITVKAQSGLDATGCDLDQLKAQIGRDTGRMAMNAAEDLDTAWTSMESRKRCQQPLLTLPAPIT
jgi:hypothetical protein